MKRRRGEGGLSAREMEIAGCLAKGMARRAIAKQLFISPFTVNNHIANIYQRLGIGNQTALLVWWYEAREGGRAA